MSKKTYTLELTAEELRRLDERGYAATCGAIADKLEKLRDQAKADREQDELRLPWRAQECQAGMWLCVPVDGGELPLSERATKLRAAAGELLSAVMAARDYYNAGSRLVAWKDVDALIERALRKVSTGVPE